MKTLTVKADDTASAMDEIVEKLGEDALILSTTKENGKIIMKASDNSVSKNSTLNQEKSFDKIFESRLTNNNMNPKKTIPQNQNQKPINLIKNQGTNISEIKEFQKNSFSVLTDRINSLEDRLSSMVLVGQEGINPELNASTYMQLLRSGFEINTIKRLRESYSGLPYENGVDNFLKSLADKLTFNHDYKILNKKFIFVVGPSGSGRTSLSAKLAACIKEKYPHKEVSLASLSQSTIEHTNKLCGFARVLNIPLSTIDYEFEEQQFSKMNDFDTMIIDTTLDPEEASYKIKMLKNYLGIQEISTFISLSGGSSSTLIRQSIERYEGINPYIALTKLDECEIKPQEISALEEMDAKISILSGTKSVIGAIAFATSNIMLQYFNENFKLNSLELF